VPISRLHVNDFRGVGRPRTPAADDENRTRMTSLEGETPKAVARRFPYMQRKWLTMNSRE
jgi:hypothetical protein